ncbi:MAG TPA: DUF1080 domain-containing protein [Gemmatimonadales bacterium]|nr:DUF1080 domain-containing protein [Gemmatimonadales bacterium]
MAWGDALRVAALVVLVGVAVGCGAPAPAAGQGPHNALTPAERAAGWQLLFDGVSTAGWRGYRSDSMPAGWQAVDGALTRVADATDIITREQFANFELTLEWKLGPGGNSGVMFRVTEEYDYGYKSGPEMQVLDDAGHADGQSRLTAAGADYGLHPPPPGVARPAGEWNQVRILVNGAHVEYWLNGTKTVDYQLGSPDWERRIAGSKFAQWPNFGRAPRGHISLQDHGDWVAYRNVKVREIR